MTIILPKSYEAEDEIRQHAIPCITEEQALREDIRALRIGILNVFGFEPEYETCLLHPMGKSVMQIDPVWIRLKTNTYSGLDMQRFYAIHTTFEEAVKERPLDGLLISASADVYTPCEELAFWPEMCRILKYARNNIPTTLGISWGAQALSAFLGIPDERYDSPLCGIYEAENLEDMHPITCVMDDRFFCPISRSGGVSDKALEKAQQNGNLVLLAKTADAGYLMAQTSDNRFCMHFGHPEWETDNVIEQCRIAHERAKTDVCCFSGFDADKPVNTWRSHRTALFSQWIKYIHESRSY